jgi:hypothetical protein
LIERVTISIDEDSEWVDLAVNWIGGRETRTRFRRPVGKLGQLEGHDELMARIHELRRGGFTACRIAEKLNAEGWVTPTQRNSFNERLIHMMLGRHGFVARGPKAPPSDDPSEWRLADLAKELEMPVVTLYGWHTRGLIKTKRVNGQWVAIADKDELRRLRRLRQQHISHH